MLESYYVNQKQCSWKYFKSQVEKYPDIPMSVYGKQVTSKQLLTYARPKLRFKK
jgi:hypothetical protein